MSDSIGYENHKCHFNFPGCQKDHAGYSRAEDSNIRGPVYDACESCARRPYPQPKQFKDANEVKESNE